MQKAKSSSSSSSSSWKQDLPAFSHLWARVRRQKVSQTDGGQRVQTAADRAEKIMIIIVILAMILTLILIKIKILILIKIIILILILILIIILTIQTDGNSSVSCL